MFSTPLTYALLGLCSLPLAGIMFGTFKYVWEKWESRSAALESIADQVRLFPLPMVH